MTQKATPCVVLMTCALAACGGDKAGDKTGSMGSAGATAGSAGTTAGVFGNPTGGMAGGGTGGGTGGAADSTNMSDAGGMQGPPEPGRCAPGDGPDVDALQAMGKLEVLVKDGGSVTSSVVHDGDLYVTRGGIGLQRLPESGAAPETLIANTGPQVSLLGVDDGYLYFKPEDAPYSRVPIDDFGATPEVQGGTPRGVARAIVGGTLYGFGPDSPELWRQEFATGALEILATVQESIGGLDVADGYVYYADNSIDFEDIFRVPIDGGSTEQIATGFNFFRVQDVRVIDGKVYWADGYRMHVTDPNITDQKTSTANFGGYGPNRSTCSVCNGTRGGGNFMGRGDRIYWTDDAGNVGWTSKDRTQCGAVFIQGSSLFPDSMRLGTDHAYVFPEDAGNPRIWRTAL